MTTRPTRIAQTTSEAKREHKKNGPCLPDCEQRQLERAYELEQRAAKIREQDERRRIAKKKREEKERKEREIRRQLGVGLATQLAGYSHTQRQMKGGMEAFVGWRKKNEEEKRKEEELRNKLEAIAEDMDKEPWDSDGDEMIVGVTRKETECGNNTDQWSDDDLDDDALLQLHDQIMSESIEKTPQPLPGPQPPPPLPKESHVPQKSDSSKDDPEFIRLHGPINKSIEKILESLPDPLMELLSQDISTNLPAWDPAPSLLHMLNPVDMPPHRLRIKMGCVVMLLRDLNTSGQLSKSSHLRVLRVEKERLECIVLDGQLEGTKTFITRVPFPGRYRNEDQYPFQRIQFPIRVSVDYSTLHVFGDAPQQSLKLPSNSGPTSKRTGSFKKPPLPVSKSKPTSNPNPSFRMPSILALKTLESPIPSKPEPLSAPILIDYWDDFLDSGTQIARELSPDASIGNAPPVVLLSTQDRDSILEDIKEPAQSTPKIPDGPSKPAMRSENPVIAAPSKSPKKSPRKLLRLKSTASELGAKAAIPPSARPPHRPDNKRKAPLKTVPTPTGKRLAVEVAKPATASTKPSTPTSFGSFGEFGISTQEVVSMIDDDESTLFSSPPIAV